MNLRREFLDLATDFGNDCLFLSFVGVSEGFDVAIVHLLLFGKGGSDLLPQMKILSALLFKGELEAAKFLLEANSLLCQVGDLAL